MTPRLTRKIVNQCDLHIGNKNIIKFNFSNEHYLKLFSNKRFQSTLLKKG